jgi:hypothetical protein
VRVGEGFLEDELSGTSGSAEEEDMHFLIVVRYGDRVEVGSFGL